MEGFEHLRRNYITIKNVQCVSIFQQEGLTSINLIKKVRGSIDDTKLVEVYCLTNISGDERLNCWEFMKCGREEGGINVEKHGVCPAYSDHGDYCVAIAGTLCGEVVQGSFALRFKNRMKYAFYKGNYCNV